MNGQTITAQDLLSEISLMESSLSVLKKKILSLLPLKYGSDAWWEKMDQEGLEQIKKGQLTKFQTTKELKKYLGL